MTSRLRTVILDANRTDGLSVSVDTALRGVLRIPKRFFEDRRISGSRVLRRLIGDRYGALSYIADWREALCDSPALEVTAIVNITNLVDYRRSRTAIREADLVIILHSAAGDDMRLLNRTAHWFHGRRGKLAVFIGNEYDLIDEKKRFIRESGTDLICSQLPADTARWLYSDCTPSRVVELPHALNPRAYYDLGRPRSIDIGFIGDLYERTVGDRERTALIEYFQRSGGDRLRCDIRLNRRLPRKDWNDFLNDCRGIIGAESGSYYLDKKGAALQCARNYRRTHDGASFQEVFEMCFQPARDYRSGKAISSRHFEPIGARTCQVLIEGRYNDILRPEEHYISVRKDLSDIRESISRFKDVAYRTNIVRQAFDHVMSGHTHAYRVGHLVQQVAQSGELSARPSAASR